MSINQLAVCMKYGIDIHMERDPYGTKYHFCAFQPTTERKFEKDIPSNPMLLEKTIEEAISHLCAPI